MTSKHTRSSSLRTFIVLVCLSVAASGCAPRTANFEPGKRIWDGCAIAGAIIGGTGAVPGGIAIAHQVGGTQEDLESDQAFAGAIGGALVGSIVGAVIGHYICDPFPPAPVKAPCPACPPPPPPPPPPPAKIFIPPKRIVLRGVHFDFNKYDIRADSEPILDEAGRILKDNPDLVIHVDGYCDIIGSEEYNQRLSERRADAVAHYLEAHGISRSRLITRGFGKTNFIASNDTDEGRAQNRRVELVPVK